MQTRIAVIVILMAGLVAPSQQKEVAPVNGGGNSTAEGKPLNEFLEWLLGITGGVGDSPTTKPPVNDPEPTAINPANCPACGKNNNNNTSHTIQIRKDKKCKKCACGKTNKKTRIIGGQETKVNEYPWMALLMYNGRFYCGATLINNKYLLTASHCVDGFTRTKITARLRDHLRDSTSESAHIDRKIAQIRKHRGYNENNFNNDIALLKLDKDVEFKGEMRPVCMPPRGRSFTGLQGIVTGWGVTKAGGTPSQILQEVTVPVMSNTDCRKSAYGERKITDNMMCAGYPEGKKDSCQGDSGGPLHVVNGTVHQIIGVVSWGEGCAVPNYPGVYARVNRYITWIEKYTQDACYCK